MGLAQVQRCLWVSVSPCLTCRQWFHANEPGWASPYIFANPPGSSNHTTEKPISISIRQIESPKELKRFSTQLCTGRGQDCDLCFGDFSLYTGAPWIEDPSSGYWVFNPLVFGVRTSSYLRSVITQHWAFDWVNFWGQCGTVISS